MRGMGRPLALVGAVVLVSAGLLPNAAAGAASNPAPAAVAASCPASSPATANLLLGPRDSQVPVGGREQLYAFGLIPLRRGDTATFRVACGPDAGESGKAVVGINPRSSNPGPAVPFAALNVINHGGPGTDVVTVTVTSPSATFGPVTTSVAWVQPVDCGLPAAELGYLRTLECRAKGLQGHVDAALNAGECALTLASFLAPELKLETLLRDIQNGVKGLSATRLATKLHVDSDLAQLAIDLGKARSDGQISNFSKVVRLFKDSYDLAGFVKNLRSLIGDIGSNRDIRHIAVDVLKLAGLGPCLNLLAMLTTRGKPRIVTTRLPNGTVGEPYNAELTTADHRVGIWTLFSGKLPAGLRLRGYTISGTPTKAGSGRFVLKFTDNRRLTATASATVRIQRSQPSTVSAAVAPLPSDADKSGRSQLLGMSCPAPQFCVAVGQYTTSLGVTNGLIDTFSNGKWSAQAEPTPDGTTTPGLLGVGCASATFCVAYGGSTIHTFSEVGIIDVYNGSSWTPAWAPAPPEAVTPGYGSSFDFTQQKFDDAQNLPPDLVSCSSTTCLVGGLFDWYPSQGNYQSDPSVIVATARSLSAVDLVSSGMAEGSQISAVACTTSDECLVGGSDQLAYRSPAGDWKVTPSPAASMDTPANQGRFAAATCPTGGNECVVAEEPGCLVVDTCTSQLLEWGAPPQAWSTVTVDSTPSASSLGSVAGSAPYPWPVFGCAPAGTAAFCVVAAEDWALSFDGSTWSHTSHTGILGRSSGVACVAQGSCLSVGSVPVAWGDRPTLAVLRANAWSAVSVKWPAGAMPGDNWAFSHAVAALGSGGYMVVGSYENSSGTSIADTLRVPAP